MTNEKEIESYIEQMANGKHLRIGMTPSVSESFVPKYLAAYIRKNAEIHFQFLVDDMQQLRGNLANGTLDVVFSEQFFLNGSIFEQHIYHQEQLTLVSDPDPSGGSSKVSFKIAETDRPYNRAALAGLREIIMHWLNSRSMALTDF